jgi:hypothetical protein
VACRSVGRPVIHSGQRGRGVARSVSVLEPPAGVAGFDDVAVVRQAVEHGSRHLGVTDHLLMPRTSTGESLTSGSLILGMPFMEAVSRSVIAAPAAAQSSLWSDFRMGGSDRLPDRRRIGGAVQRSGSRQRSDRCTFLCGRFYR